MIESLMNSNISFVLRLIFSKPAANKIKNVTSLFRRIGQNKIFDLLTKVGFLPQISWSDTQQLQSVVIVEDRWVEISQK